MPGSKTNDGLQMWILFSLHDVGSSLGLNDDPDVKLLSVGWCMVSLAGPTVAQLEVFFSFDYLGVMGAFHCFIIVC